MIPTAESDRTTRYERFGGSRTARSLVLLSALVAGSFVSPTAHASGELVEDQAVIVGSDGVIYSLNLSDAKVTSTGVSLSGTVPPASYSALEADPTTDTLYLTSAAQASLSTVNFASGSTSYIEDDYGTSAFATLTSLVRSADGALYMSYDPPNLGKHSVSRVDLSNGQLSNTQEVTLGGVSTVVSALAESGGVVYAFGLFSADQLFSLNLSTGELTSVRSASSRAISGQVVGADTDSSGLIYFLTFSAPHSVLYSTDPTGESVTQIGQVSGLPDGITAEHIAIATLLDSERPEPEPEPEPETEPEPQPQPEAASSPSPRRDRDDDDDDEKPAAVEPEPLVAPSKPVAEEPEELSEPAEEEQSLVSEAPESQPEPPAPAETTPPDQTDSEASGEVIPVWLIASVALGLVVFFAGFMVLIRRMEKRS